MDISFTPSESGLFTDFSDFINSGLDFVLVGLFLFGIMGILWAIFKKATEEKYPLFHMIQTIVLNLIMIVLVFYTSNYLGKSIFELIQNIFS